MNRIILAALAIAAVVGCAKEEQSGGGDSLAASFTSSITTRVSGTQWDEGDQIGVMVTTGSEPHANYRYNNLYDVSFTDPKQGLFSAHSMVDQIYFSVDEADYIHFYAYYPYNADLVESELSYPVSVVDQSKPKLLDFMEASTASTEGYNKDSGTVALNFTRNMSKITLKLKAGTGLELSDITAVRYAGFSNSATYDFPTNTFGSLAGSDVEITPLDEGDNIYSAILIPENTAKHTIYFTIKNGERVPLDLSEYTLSKGDHYYFTVTVSQTEASSELNGIVGWGDADIDDDSFETE